MQLVETTRTLVKTLSFEFYSYFFVLGVEKKRPEIAAHREKLKSFYSDKLRKSGRWQRQWNSVGVYASVQVQVVCLFRWAIPQRFRGGFFRAWRQFEDFSPSASLNCENCGHFRRCFKLNIPLKIWRPRIFTTKKFPSNHNNLSAIDPCGKEPRKLG